MKPFLLLSILLHQPQPMIPAAQWFDTNEQCEAALALQAWRMVQADDEADVRSITDGRGHTVLILVSKRFQAWCEDSSLLDPAMARTIELARPTP